MHIIHISDTHNTYPDIPECDLLIHSGDLTNHGTIDEVREGLDWLSRQPASSIIYVPGNHDMCLDASHMYGMVPVNFEAFKKEYEHRIVIEINTTFTVTHGTVTPVSVGVCSYQPFFGGWGFNVSSKLERKEYYKKALEHKPDILITHAPPKYILDKNRQGEFCGDEALSEVIKENPNLHPKFLLCGHIHESSGWAMFPNTDIKISNAATIMNEFIL